MGAVQDWNNVEPHHFRSAPAVHSGVILDGGFLPRSAEEELQKLRQDVHDLRKLIIDFFFKVANFESLKTKTNSQLIF
jgi:hypothetical protein